MGILISSRAAWHAVGKRLGMAGLWINRPMSESGRIRLTSPDPSAPARVDFDLLSDERDVQRLKDGFRRLAAIQLSPYLDGAADNAFPASYSERIRKVGALTWQNRMLTRVGALLLDGPAALRRAVIDHFVAEGDGLARLLGDDDRLDGFVRAKVAGLWHASCSCRIGADGDPMAVLTSRGQVRKLASLRVADASAFPAIPSANTNLPVMMLAEKMAGYLAGEP